MQKYQNLNQTNQGTVLSIRGSVVDAHFSRNIPAINNLLKADDNWEIMIAGFEALTDSRKV